MKRLVLVLGLALMLPATAQAANISPEKQAALEQRNWSITDEEDTGPVPAGMKQCPHGRAKGIGSRIRNWNGATMIRGYAKLAVCADNGHVWWSNLIYRHASPSRYWHGVGKPSKNVRNCCGGGRWANTIQTWVDPDYSVDQYWQLTINIRAHVRGDHDIWFSKTRAWR